jgi:hypothetical protein
VLTGSTTVSPRHIELAKGLWLILASPSLTPNGQLPMTRGEPQVYWNASQKMKYDERFRDGADHWCEW